MRESIAYLYALVCSGCLLGSLSLWRGNTGPAGISLRPLVSPGVEPSPCLRSNALTFNAKPFKKHGEQPCLIASQDHPIPPPADSSNGEVCRYLGGRATSICYGVTTFLVARSNDSVTRGSPMKQAVWFRLVIAVGLAFVLGAVFLSIAFASPARPQSTITMGRSPSPPQSVTEADGGDYFDVA